MKAASNAAIPTMYQKKRHIRTGIFVRYAAMEGYGMLAERTAENLKEAALAEGLRIGTKIEYIAIRQEAPGKKKSICKRKGKVTELSRYIFICRMENGYLESFPYWMLFGVKGEAIQIKGGKRTWTGDILG